MRCGLQCQPIPVTDPLFILLSLLVPQHHLQAVSDGISFMHFPHCALEANEDKHQDHRNDNEKRDHDPCVDRRESIVSVRCVANALETEYSALACVENASETDRSKFARVKT